MRPRPKGSPLTYPSRKNCTASLDNSKNGLRLAVRRFGLQQGFAELLIYRGPLGRCHTIKGSRGASRTSPAHFWAFKRSGWALRGLNNVENASFGAQIPQNQCSYAEFDLGRSRFLPPDCPLDGPTGGDNNAGALPAQGAKDRG